MAIEVQFPDGRKQWMASITAMALLRQHKVKALTMDTIVSTNEAAATEIAIDAKREMANANAAGRTARAMNPADIG
jgi:hypothetical protein